MADVGLGRGRSARPLAVAAIIAAVALVAWVVTLDRMRGMDAGPGTDLGALPWFLGIWATMMAAMMLPATVPVVVLFARSSPAVRTAAFVVGYLAVWVGGGVVAYAIYRGIDAVDGGLLAWDRGGPYVAGAAVVAAGLYQLTPLKAVCLRHCRSPLHLLLTRARPGVRGAARMGAEHGFWCAGCCWALMLVLFAVGVMSLFWMAVIAVVVFAEKALPAGPRLSAAIGVALVALGLGIALVPDRVPNLTQPSDRGAMQTMPMG